MKALILFTGALISLQALAIAPLVNSLCVVTKPGRRGAETFRLRALDPNQTYGLIAEGASRSGIKVSLRDRVQGNPVIVSVEFPTGGYSVTEQVTITGVNPQRILIRDSERTDGNLSCTMNVQWRN